MRIFEGAVPRERTVEIALNALQASVPSEFIRGLELARLLLQFPSHGEVLLASVLTERSQLEVQ